MANYNTLKEAINNFDWNNGENLISGPNVRDCLLALINSLGANYQFVGVATPETNPGTPDQNVFYIAGTGGTYINFNNIVVANEVAALVWNGSWTKQNTGIKFVSVSQNTSAEGGDYKLNIGSNSYDIGGVNIINLTANEYTSPVVAAQNVPERLRKCGTIIIYRYTGRSAADPLEVWQFSHTNVSQWGVLRCWQNMQEQKDCFVIPFDTDFSTTVFKIDSFNRKKGLLVGIVKYSESPQFYTFNSNNTGESTWGNETYWRRIAMANELSGLLPIKYGNNIFNKETITTGKYFGSNGDINNNASYSISDYISVDAETLYHIKRLPGGTRISGSSTYDVFYNASKRIISTITADTMEVTTPQNCAFIRLSMFAGVPNEVVVSKADISNYEPYSPIGGYPIVIEDLSGSQILDGSIAPSKLVNANFSRLRNGTKVEIASLANGDTFEDDNFPQTIKKSKVINLHITNLTSFTGVYVGWGKTGTYGVSVYVDATKVYIVRGPYSGTKTEIGSHGLTISTFLSVTIVKSDNGNAKIIVDTLSGSYTCEYAIGLYYTRGKVYVMSDSTVATGVTLTVSSIDLSRDVWIFGDSYLSISDNRWPYYFFNLGIQNVSWFAYPGATTENQYDDLLRALNFGKPKYLVWALGMNNTDTTTSANSTWMDRLTNVINLCAQYQITLILATIPCVPASGHENYFKNEVVRQSGYRYIDFAKSVNAEAQGATWYAGMLGTDDLHPTVIGAKTLANQVFKDFPEIMLFDNLNYTISNP